MTQQLYPRYFQRSNGNMSTQALACDFIAVLFLLMTNETMQMSIYRQTDNGNVVYPMACYLARKRNVLQLFETMWRSLSILLLSKWSQAPRSVCCMILFTYNFRKCALIYSDGMRLVVAWASVEGKRRSWEQENPGVWWRWVGSWLWWFRGCVYLPKHQIVYFRHAWFIAYKLFFKTFVNK